VVSIPDLIEKQPRWSIVITDEEICVAVVINIPERCPTPNLDQRKFRSQLIYNLNKTCFPRVAKELIRLAQRKRILLSHELR